MQTTSNSVVPLANSSQFFRAILLTQALPQIVSFNINPATLSSNGPATLNWLVNGAARVMLDHSIGDVTGTTSRLATVTGTSTYKLVATNSVGSATGLATVVVGQLPRRAGGIQPLFRRRWVSIFLLRAWCVSLPRRMTRISRRISCRMEKAATPRAWNIFFDNQVVQTMNGEDAEYWVFRNADKTSPLGRTCCVLGHYTNATMILDSDPVTFTVDAPPPTRW